METIAPSLIEAALAAARESGRRVADVPLDEIARRAGVSRATLYRRIGSRRRLEAALRELGVDPGRRPDVRERAVAAAAAIVRERGPEALTLEAVAAAAGCSVPALHSRLGGREGLLAALFERYSPLPRVERIVEAGPPDLASGVRAIYGALFDAAVAEPRLIRAVFADALSRPRGPAARYLTGTYIPRAMASVGGWLAGEVAAGRCRPLPIPLLLQLLIAPMAMHAPTRGLVGALGAELPPREETIELLAAAFCRAAAPDPAGPSDADRFTDPVSADQR